MRERQPRLGEQVELRVRRGLGVGEVVGEAAGGQLGQVVELDQAAHRGWNGGENIKYANSYSLCGM